MLRIKYLQVSKQYFCKLINLLPYRAVSDMAEKSEMTYNVAYHLRELIKHI